MDENERRDAGRPRLPGDPYFREAVRRKRETVVAGPPFWEDLPGLFKYPVRGGGWLVIALSSFFFGALFWSLQALSRLGFGGFLLGVILSTGFLGYIANYLLSVTKRTTTHPDEQDPPGWPDFKTFLEQAAEFGRVFTICLVPLLIPVAAYFIIGWSVSFEPNPLILGAILMPGFFYLPMSVLVYAVSDNIADALNPVLVFRSIFLCGGPYFAMLPFLFLILVLFEIAWFLSGYLPLSWIAFYFLAFYFSMIVFRTLGLLYMQCRTRLGWFDEA